MFTQILHPNNSSELTIRIPDEFIAKDIKVMVFEVDEKLDDANEIARQEKITKAFEVFDKYRVSTKGYKFDRNEANER